MGWQPSQPRGHLLGGANAEPDANLIDACGRWQKEALINNLDLTLLPTLLINGPPGGGMNRLCGGRVVKLSALAYCHNCSSRSFLPTTARYRDRNTGIPEAICEEVLPQQ